jgi:hypothetical protein
MSGVIQRGLSTGALGTEGDRRPSGWLIRLGMIVSVAFVICAFVSVGEYGAVLSWGWACAWVLATAKLIGRRGQAWGDAPVLLVFSFLVVSALGMVEALDNWRIFGTYFGKDSDDTGFYQRAVSMIQHQVWLDDTGIFEVVLAAWALPLAAFRGAKLNVLDLLPFNWYMAGLTVALCARLCRLVTGKETPHWILGATLLCNFNFVDTVVHLYRDALLAALMVGGVVLQFEARRLIPLLLGVPILLLRGATFGLYLAQWALLVLRRAARQRWQFYCGVGMGTVATVLLLSSHGGILLGFSSGIGRQVWGSSSIPEGSFGENVRSRAKMVAGDVKRGSVLQGALEQGTVGGTLLRPAMYVLFPIRISSLEVSRASKSADAGSIKTANPIALMNLYTVITVSAWIVTVPLLVVGLFRALLANSSVTALGVQFLVGVAFVSQVSFQMRHGMAFIILIPALAALGEVARCERPHHRSAVVALRAGVFVLIAAYNLYGFLLR